MKSASRWAGTGSACVIFVLDAICAIWIHACVLSICGVPSGKNDTNSPSHHVSAFSRSHPSVKLAPVRVFSCKHPLLYRTPFLGALAHLLLCKPIEREVSQRQGKHNTVLRKYLFIQIKDGAYYCYCAYLLRISRYSDFLSPMLTNTEILLRDLKLSGESRS